MQAKHIFTAIGVCPVNGAEDNYTIIVKTDRIIDVHEIVKIARDILKKPIFQEDLTAQLAEAIDAKVTTHCLHGNVSTKVKAG